MLRHASPRVRDHTESYFNLNANIKPRIAVIGLGYVGLPLAVAFSHEHDVTGFDIRSTRISELEQGYDRTKEVSSTELTRAKRLSFSNDAAVLEACNTFVITVPTPIDSARAPDLGPLSAASRTVGAALSQGDVVIYESTVFPGCTEEICVPILEKASGLKYNSDFFVGYSPERINPGDTQKRLGDIVKVTSGSTPGTAQYVDALYKGIIKAGTHLASSIKVAEAAKVIENTQRDLNIALVNDLAILFNKLGIDTHEVLEAAGTKWNFLPFRPGLVGGHCIGVDPYYLTYKAQQVGHHPDVILAGRRTNDSIGPYVADSVLRLMARAGINPVGSRILILGLAFKENTPDLRNTRVWDIIQSLRNYNANVDVIDPLVNSDDATHEYGLELMSDPPKGSYDAMILAVGHRAFVDAGTAGIREYGKETSILYDVKSIFPKSEVDGRL